MVTLHDERHSCDIEVAQLVWFLFCYVHMFDFRGKKIVSQKRIIFLCCLTYLVQYLGYLNNNNFNSYPFREKTISNCGNILLGIVHCCWLSFLCTDYLNWQGSESVHLQIFNNLNVTLQFDDDSHCNSSNTVISSQINSTPSSSL